jgi:membrane glycosyltransferase
MDTLTQNRGSGLPRREGQESFLPPESPLPMAKQQLRSVQPGDGTIKVPGYIALRRACIFVGAAAMTAVGCYEMYEVVQVGGVTILEWMVLGLYVLLFAWIALSFMSSLAGFAVLLFRVRDPLGIDPAAPLPSVGNRNAMLLPTYNEDPYRIMARLRAMYESVDQSARGSSFDWFVLSDTTDPSIWIAEEKCFLQLRRDLGASNIYYRHRRENIARKSGNIEDWIKRFGAG